MRFSHQLFALCVLGVVGASVVALIGASADKAAPGAPSFHNYRLGRGDFVRVPALGWTCMVGTLPNDSSKLGLFCDPDKPQQGVGAYISRHNVFVGIGRKPVRFHGGYLFSY